MNAVSKKPFWKEALLLTLIVFAAVKLAWVAVEYFLLPPAEESPQIESRVEHLPSDYRLASNERLQKPKPIRRKVTTSKPTGISIKDLGLLGIYRGDGKKIAVIAKKNKISLLLEGEHFFGYTVEEIGIKRVRLSRNGKEYFLDLKKENDTKGRGIWKIVPPAGSVAPQPGSLPVGPDAAGVYRLPKSEVDTYTKDFDKIWKNIKVTPHLTRGKLDGYLVRYVRNGSLFARMGLRRGDLIRAIDGEEVARMRSPQELFEMIQGADSLILTLQRGRKKVDLTYELH